MHLLDLNIKEINIPFKISFKHSSAERKVTQSIWVEAKSTQGNIGYGEGCPRQYVTNESIETAYSFFNQYKHELINEIKSLSSLKTWINNHKLEIDKNPAAWCAIELAILDCISKENKLSIEETLGLIKINNTFKYTAILGDSDFNVFTSQIERYLELGFTDFKIKISGDLKKDLIKLKLLNNKTKKENSIRLDANNLWNDATTVINYIDMLEYPIDAIEEPLKAFQYNELKKINDHYSGMKIILDESFLKIEDFKVIQDLSLNCFLNIRVSKMGGLLRSLSVIEKARELGLKIIIGAQVGETSLLTRAALTIANVSKDILISQEGAYGTLLLESDVCTPPLMFGHNGFLNFSPSEPYGFQINIIENTSINIKV